MNKLDNLILMKFGKLEHLESLKNGNIYFNTVSNYRNDGTEYRGDPNEGKVPINPETFRINGIDFSDIVVDIKQSFGEDDGILMFCTSMLTNDILVPKETTNVFSDEYKNEIMKFGDHVIIFNAKELIINLRKAIESKYPELDYRFEAITYRDLTDFKSEEYNLVYNRTGSILDSFFVKSRNYKIQNEWRLLLGSDSVRRLSYLNNNGSLLLKIDELSTGIIFPTSVLLETGEFNIPD